MSPTDREGAATMDAAGLYLEEQFTDRRVGAIRRLTPVTSDGMPDSARATLYVGQAQIMTNMGPVPISFEIEAASLAEAVSRFDDAANVAVERTAKELQELRRQSASSIVIPEGGMAGLGGAGGLPPGGRIKMP